MAYIPDATDASEPREGRGLGSAAAEFRAIKARINTIYTAIQNSITSLTASVASANANASAALAATGITLEIGELKHFVRPAATGDLTNYLVANGRKLGPTGSPADLTGDDYFALYSYLWDIAVEQSVAGVALPIFTHNGTNFVESAVPAGPPSAASAWSSGLYYVPLPDLIGRVLRGHNPAAEADHTDPDEVYNSKPDSGRIIGTTQHGSLLAGQGAAATSTASFGYLETQRELLGWDSYGAKTDGDPTLNGLPYPSPNHTTLNMKLQVAAVTGATPTVPTYQRLGVARMDNIAYTPYVRYK